MFMYQVIKSSTTHDRMPAGAQRVAPASFCSSLPPISPIFRPFIPPRNRNRKSHSFPIVGLASSQQTKAGAWPVHDHCHNCKFPWTKTSGGLVRASQPETRSWRGCGKVCGKAIGSALEPMFIRDLACMEGSCQARARGRELTVINHFWFEDY